MKLEGRRILIAGSADPETADESLWYGHHLISELSMNLAERGASFVISFGKDPKLRGRVDGPSIIFDWTVAEAIKTALTSGKAAPSGPSGKLITAVGTDKMFGQIPAGKLETYKVFRAAKCLRRVCIYPGWSSGAVRRRRQAQLADILIALSGGEGVEHLAQEFACLGKHVIPLGLDLGASSGDGTGGGARLYGAAMQNPSLFFKVVSNESGAELLDQLGTEGGTVPYRQVASSVMDLIEQLVAPRAFYVRLLNPVSPEFKPVEEFFRTVVDPLVKHLGFEPLQMGVEPSEYAWMNQSIFEGLHHSEVAVVDLTAIRPNCFMELGYALGNSQRVIVTARIGTEIPFDPSCLEIFFWDQDWSVEESLLKFEMHWARNIDTPPLVCRRESR